MPTIGALTLEIHIEHSHSLKDKRQVIRALKDRLRGRYNIAVAEVDGQDTWQRAVVTAVTVSGDSRHAESTLQAVEGDAAAFLGAMLVSTSVEWID